LKNTFGRRPKLRILIYSSLTCLSSKLTGETEFV
jgi:hypothetical protein